LRSAPAIRAIIARGAVVTVQGGPRHPWIKEHVTIVEMVELEGVKRRMAVTVHRTANGDFHYQYGYGESPGVGVPGGLQPQLKNSA
jgi:hypothetical protein